MALEFLFLPQLCDHGQVSHLSSLCIPTCKGEEVTVTMPASGISSKSDFFSGGYPRLCLPLADSPRGCRLGLTSFSFLQQEA